MTEHCAQIVVRRTLLQSILDNWAIFQDLRDGFLVEKVDSEFQGQVIGAQIQMQSLNFLFEIQLKVLVLLHKDNLLPLHEK